MASDIFTGSETISTTEHSLVTDTAGVDAETSDANLRIHLDLSAMVAGTILEIKIYEKDTSGGTARVIWSRCFAGVQATGGWQSPRSWTVRHGWDVTLDKLAGADTAVTWALIDDSGSAPSAASVADAVWDEARAGHVAAGSFGEGVVTNSIAANAVTAAAIATDAIGAAQIAADAIGTSELAASAVTKITDGFLAKVVVGTRTIKGVLKRIDAFIKGKATGLNGATAEFYDDDGTTVIISADQDTGAGTRDAATASGD